MSPLHACLVRACSLLSKRVLFVCKLFIQPLWTLTVTHHQNKKRVMSNCRLGFTDKSPHLIMSHSLFFVWVMCACVCEWVCVIYVRAMLSLSLSPSLCVCLSLVCCVSATISPWFHSSVLSVSATHINCQTELLALAVSGFLCVCNVCERERERAVRNFEASYDSQNSGRFVEASVWNSIMCSCVCVVCSFSSSFVCLCLFVRPNSDVSVLASCV